MKPRILLFALASVLSLSIFAQQTVTVEATTDDISDNLDLKAVGIIFGKARNLEEFEQMINDWKNPISNLDLNYDGEVDYLRVLESRDRKNHIIVIQAVLAEDIYQDVATIIVSKKRNKPVIQIVGDPYIYGRSYIVEPVYIYTPVIYSWFWSPSYVRWYSPYYWGYYPVYYRHYYCVPYYDYFYYMRDYYSQYHYVSYRYVDRPRYDYVESQVYRDMSRRDYDTRYPNRSFSSRNASYSNVYSRRDIERSRGVNYTPSYTEGRSGTTLRDRSNDVRTPDINRSRTTTPDSRTIDRSHNDVRNPSDNSRSRSNTPNTIDRDDVRVPDRSIRTDADSRERRVVIEDNDNNTRSADRSRRTTDESSDRRRVVIENRDNNTNTRSNDNSSERRRVVIEDRNNDNRSNERSRRLDGGTTDRRSTVESNSNSRGSDRGRTVDNDTRRNSSYSSSRESTNSTQSTSAPISRSRSIGSSGSESIRSSTPSSGSSSSSSSRDDSSRGGDRSRR